jgi:hypothetical protein
MAAVLPVPQQISRIPAEVARHVGRASVIDVHKELLKKYSRTITILNTRTICIHCGASYLPRENFISRACWMHTGRLRYNVHGLREWSCCQNPADISGCVSCMHTDKLAIRESITRDPLHSFVEIPIEMFDFKLVSFNPAIVEDYPEGGPSVEKDKTGKYYHIRRVVM